MRGVIFAAVFVLFSMISPALAVELKIAASTSAREVIFDKISGPFTVETGIKLIFSFYERPSSALLLKDLVEGKADLAVASIAYSDWTDLMKEQGVTLPPDLTSRVIGKDVMAVVGNTSSGVKELTGDQVEKIFTGKVKNWKEVNGADLPITIFEVKSKVANRQAFERIALGKKPMAGTIVFTETNAERYLKLAQNPGGVAQDSLADRDAKIAVIKTQEYGRPVTLVTKGRPTEAIEKLIQFIHRAKN